MYKVLIISFTILLLACSSSEKHESKKLETTTINDKTIMQTSANLLISKFMFELKAELMKAIKDGGFENAINACQISAPFIAEQFSSKTSYIKRVTDKPRNLLNAANEHEQKILTLFADSLKKLDFFDEWVDPDNKKDYYFYKPIRISKFCLKCHGDKTITDEKAMIAVQEKYPEDKAIDYNEGDLRGMFVVYIKDSNELPLQDETPKDSL